MSYNYIGVANMNIGVWITACERSEGVWPGGVPL
jgi:hypothetical protein